MKVLDYRKVISLADFYHQYEDSIKTESGERKGKAIIAKTKTSVLRYALPEYGFPLKLDGNLSAVETIEGLKFMEQIPIYQAPYLLEAQERVFTKFGGRVTSASRRVYRSALKKMMDWGESQNWWKQSVGTSSKVRTPTMIICKKRVEHWHKLKPEEISPKLSQQLDRFSTYLRTLRQPCLVDSSCMRYRREILGIFGWMHRVKGVTLADLDLTQIVPVASIHNPDAADKVVALAKEYFEWTHDNLGGKESILRFSLRTLFYIAEYVDYDYTKKS
ncbi:MAG TPA: hypothetical protein V6D10_00360 [Trichocoleus sp.]|jgi:hypothetical protein